MRKIHLNSYAKSSQNVTGRKISQTVMLKLRKALSGLKKEAPDLKQQEEKLILDKKYTKLSERGTNNV
ncbi:hypothetical protein M1N78_03465 [Peptococcaceae bacterium]|nr:hypothetical protein [Peptococcaceae bacterium]